MLKHCLAPVLALVFSLFVPSAYAFYDPPYITPEHPVTGETISVSIRAGICDAIVGIPGWPQISQEGNAIHILFWSTRDYDPVFCNAPVGTTTHVVGAYPPGSYTLQVDRFDHLLVSGEPAAETLGIIPFTVAGGATAPVSAPASSVAGLGSLALGIVGLAVWMLHSRLGHKHYAASVLALVFSLFVQSAHAFYDPPYITPEHPAAGEAVSVNIRGGICDALVGRPGYPQITQDGNAIRILFWSVYYGDFEFCNFSVGTGTFAVGAYPAGSYTLQVDRFDHLLVSGEPATETLGIIPFTVTGAAAPVSANALGAPGLGVLTLALIAWAVGTLRTRRPDLLIVALCMLPGASRAQDAPDRVLELLVTTAPGAPTAEELVAYYQRPDGPPPLAGLTVENPQAVQYLTAQRAEGEFLEHLRAHPDTARARLERYVLVLYPEGADLDRALAALRADPYVARANAPIAMDFDSAEMTLFDVDGGGPSIDGGYGRDALNIDAAWQIAGGYAWSRTSIRDFSRTMPRCARSTAPNLSAATSCRSTHST